MGQHTHHLPKHLGNWPCTVVKLEAFKGTALVQYDADDGTHQLTLDAGLLTPIRPDEPSTPYALAQDGCVWQTHDTDEHGYAARTWRNTVNGSVITWDHLWDRHGPIRPLVEVPHVTVPWTSSDATDFRIYLEAQQVSSHPIKVHKGEDWTYLTADEAEEFAAALLDAARKARTHIAAKLAPGYEAFIEKAQQGMAEFGEHTAETDRPPATGGIITGNPPYVINEGGQP